MFVACCSESQIQIVKAIVKVCIAKRDQRFLPTPASSFPDEYAVPEFLQPSKANRRAAFGALEAFYSSTTEKMANTHRSQAGQGGRISRTCNPLFPHSLSNCLQTASQFLCLPFLTKYIVVVCVSVCVCERQQTARMRLQHYDNKTANSLSSQGQPCNKLVYPGL